MLMICGRNSQNNMDDLKENINIYTNEPELGRLQTIEAISFVLSKIIQIPRIQL